MTLYDTLIARADEATLGQLVGEPAVRLLRLLDPKLTRAMSIDDNETHYLKVVMDEVFGRKNFVANVVWQKSYTSNQTAKFISDTYDHILLYTLNPERFSL